MVGVAFICCTFVAKIKFECFIFFISDCYRISTSKMNKFPTMISILKKQQTTNNRPTTVKELLEANVEKPQNGKRGLDDHDYTCMSPPKKTVNVTLDSDNKIKDSCIKSIPTPKTTQCTVYLTETAAKATTSSASLHEPSFQLLFSTSTTLSDDTLDKFLGPDTTLDDHLD